MLLNIIVAALIVILLTFIAYEDYKKSRIYNKRIIQILLIGFTYYLISFFIFLLGTYEIFTINIHYAELNTFLFALKSFITSAVLSYILWHFHFWGAGDAKLFLALSFSLPPFFYSQAALYTFPALPLAINIFFPLFCIILLRFLYFPWSYGIFIIEHPQLVLKNIELFIKNTSKEIKKNWIDYLSSFFGFALIFILYRISRLYFSDYWDGVHLDSYIFLLTFSILIAAFYFFKNYIKGKRALYIILFFLIIFHFLYVYLFNFASLAHELKVIFIWGPIMMLGVLFIYYLYLLYIAYMELKPVKISELKVGDVLDISVAKIIGYEKLAEYLSQLSTPLTQRNIRELKKLFQEYYQYCEESMKQKDLVAIDTLHIHRTTHFGIWFLFGTVLTMILKTSVVSFFFHF